MSPACRIFFVKVRNREWDSGLFTNEPSQPLKYKVGELLQRTRQN